MCGALVGRRIAQMETLDIWTPADALAFRCSLEEVGSLRAPDPVPVLAGRADADLARTYAPRALRALARIMEGSDGRAGVEAAREILSRAYGPALTSANAPTSAGAVPLDPWIDPEARLAYKITPDNGLLS